MHPTTRLLSVHKPMIKFIGKRSWPKSSEQHAHPYAPSSFALPDFLKKFEASGSKQSSSSKESSSGKPVFSEFWEAPSRFWQPRTRQFSKAEINAIASGGASAF